MSGINFDFDPSQIMHFERPFQKFLKLKNVSKHRKYEHQLISVSIICK